MSFAAKCPRHLILWVLICSLWACGDASRGVEETDATPDGQMNDVLDAGTADGGRADGGLLDAEPDLDLAGLDAGPDASPMADLGVKPDAEPSTPWRPCMVVETGPALGEGVRHVRRLSVVVIGGAPLIRAERLDLYDDGAVDVIVERTFSEEGWLLEERLDLGGEGAPDYIERLRYDRDGRHIATEIAPEGGAFSLFERRLFDAEGRWVGLEVDRGPDGQVDDRTEITLNAEGRPWRLAEDIGDDGVIDRRLAYGYDDQGRQVLLDEDQEADGRVDVRTAWRWGPSGVESESRDLGADGVIEVRWQAVYGPEGHLEAWLEDRGDDGTVDVEARWLVEGDPGAECDVEISPEPDP